MGFGISAGNNFINWQQPQNFGLGWNNNANMNLFGFDNNFGWGNSTGSVSTTSSSSSSIHETADEYEARIKRELAQKNAQIQEIFSQKQEAQKALTEIEKQKTALNGTVKKDGSVEIKGSIQADGTIKEEKLENISTGSKIMRGVGNFFSGIGNVCKSFVGIDPKTGKWDPLKCLRNVGVAVAVGTLCVFAAPLGAAAAAALGGGAIAAGVGTAVAAAPTALAYLGLGTGAYLAGKGVYNTAKADTLEEFDNATQDIGAGVFIGASSAMGLRGISKTAGVASASEGTIGSSISAGTKNILVNPWKASAQNFQVANARFSTARTFGASFKESFSLANQGVKEAHANVARDAFLSQKQKLTTQLEQQIADVEARYSAATSAKDKALLELEYDGLVNQYSQLESLPSTKVQWKSFGKANKEYNAQLKEYKKAMRPWGKGEVEIGGQKFTTADKSALSSTIKSIRKTQKGIDSQMSSLKKARFDSMKSMAKSSDSAHQTEVQEFGFSNKWYSTPYNWVQSKYYGFTMRKGIFGKGMMLANGAFYAVEPVWALQGTAKTSAAMPLNGMYAFNPTRESSKDLTTVLPAEQIAQAKSGLDTQAQQLKDAIAQYDAKLSNLA